MIWSLIGWGLIGGFVGYSLKRWRWTVTIAVGLLGVAFVLEPSPPQFEMGGSWWNLVVFVVGNFIGQYRAEQDMATGKVGAHQQRVSR